MQKNCETCKKIFRASNKYRLYCSTKCKIGLCDYCSKEFLKHDNSSKFCSRSCFFSWRKSQNNSPTEKKCCRCKQIKSIVLFSSAQTRKDGYQTLCKVCKSEVNKKNYCSTISYLKTK